MDKCKGMVWSGMVWCGMAWYGMAWYGMAERRPGGEEEGGGEAGIRYSKREPNLIEVGEIDVDSKCQLGRPLLVQSAHTYATEVLPTRHANS